MFSVAFPRICRRLPLCATILATAVILLYAAPLLSAAVPPTGARIDFICPASGALSGCRPVGGARVETGAYLVTMVTGNTLSEMALLNGAPIQSSAALLKEGGGFYRWWPIAGRKGSFSYTVVPPNGSPQTKTINLY